MEVEQQHRCAGERETGYHKHNGVRWFNEGKDEEEEDGRLESVT